MGLKPAQGGYSDVIRQMLATIFGGTRPWFRLTALVNVLNVARMKRSVIRVSGDGKPRRHVCPGLRRKAATSGLRWLTPTISAPRHPTKPENTKPLRGAGALDQRVRH